MYNINSHQDGYCLLSYYTYSDRAYATDPISVHQATPFCLRTSAEDNFIANFNFNNSMDANFTFAQLKSYNVTSEMLLSWSASIDLAEQYEIYINNKSHSLLESETLFYNCTSAWFGPFCCFTFDYYVQETFDDIVHFTFTSKSRSKNVQVTCYKHLPYCETLLPCLDWREICDGKNDCLDGSDEENCWQLEVNECSRDEYRCHNGLCIPIEFLYDYLQYPDCMDRTDERFIERSLSLCPNLYIFPCEEHTYQPGTDDFPCGDGKYTNGIYQCNNRRSNALPGDFCSNATACLMQLNSHVDTKWCKKFCSTSSCIAQHCPILYEFRSIIPLLGHVRLIFANKKVESTLFPLPEYVCYDEKRCIDFLPATKSFNNLTCRNFSDLGFENINLIYNLELTIAHINQRFRACLIEASATDYCNHQTMYRCRNSSKCITKQRILDGLQDCPFNDDETFNQSCLLPDVHQRFKCSTTVDERCFASIVVLDGKKDCEYGEDEIDQTKQRIRNDNFFPKICDEVTDLSPELIDEQNVTDETGCEHWSCNNTYSRCDGFWLCANGADEVNCPPSTCPEHHHSCVFPNDTSTLSCLPIARAGNGFEDCLGGTDERRYHMHYTTTLNYAAVTYYFHCRNSTQYIDIDEICNGNADCEFKDDEEFCTVVGTLQNRFCVYYRQFFTEVDHFFCSLRNKYFRMATVYFKLTNMATYPTQLTIENNSNKPSTQTNLLSGNEAPIYYPITDYQWWCNRGVPIRIRMNDYTSELYCLCPPSYYGIKCQYQNQRVSLTVQVRVTSDWRRLFIFLITLIDNDRNVQSHDSFEYVPILDCKGKFNVYLLYSTRPRNASSIYSVQIEAFDHVTLKYRASWIFPLQFSFLPVHRLPVLLRVPPIPAKPTYQCWPPCAHGQCFYYVNNQSWTFCRCQLGWSGTQCNINYTCDCATGSICISNSICLCPSNRFGSRCHLVQYSCHLESCLNGGQCITVGIRQTRKFANKTMCICPEGYGGDRCQYRTSQIRIDISFHRELSIPPFLSVHFITVQAKAEHNQTSIIKKIGYDQYSLVVFTSLRFNIALAQIYNSYYLIILREKVITLANISTEITPSHRCRSIAELFNGTLINQHPLKRIKYYHIPCQEHDELICFHDDVHMCLCTLHRTSNCFEFNHNITYDCEGSNLCENEGYCFRDDPTCPSPPICACHQCYFGSKCQFSTKGSTLSLDIILGYHIRFGSAINQQPIIVKMAIALTTSIFLFGFISISFSLLTFGAKEIRNVGCGLYLFTSSVISLIIVIIFMMKFWLLLTSQIDSINNRLLLHIQCIVTDFLLRTLLSISDWLSACVAIERAVNVSQGVKFSRAKSKRIAKWIILIVILGISCTHIYDPLHRHLIDDEEERRTWCVTQYPSRVQVFNGFLNIFHFSLPFSINCISATIVIIIVARTRSNSQKKKTFKEHLREQLQYHKHLLISPLILVVLALPRLIISFLSGCMKSPRDSWLYLIGYFIAFIPSMMTFVVFVLPSEVYKKQFSKSIHRIWQRR